MCQSEIGYPAQKRTHILTDNWSVVNTGNPITCNGYITKWHFMPARSEPFKICIWRPASQTDPYRFELISCTYVPAVTVVDKKYSLETHVPVREGDAIGYTFRRNPLYSTEDGACETECVWKNNNMIKNFGELRYGSTVRFDTRINTCAFAVYGEFSRSGTYIAMHGGKMLNFTEISSKLPSIVRCV